MDSMPTLARMEGTCKQSEDRMDATLASLNAVSILPKFWWFIRARLVSSYSLLYRLTRGTAMGTVPLMSTPSAARRSILRGCWSGGG